MQLIAQLLLLRLIYKFHRDMRDVLSLHVNERKQLNKVKNLCLPSAR